MVNCFRILHSSAGLFIVFTIYCVVDVSNWMSNDECTWTCLEKDIVRHELVGHLGENLCLEGEVLGLARLLKDE